MNTEPEQAVDKHGSKYWCAYGLLHREDGPAVILPDGSKFWYHRNQLHRTDAPAVILPDGSQRWFLNGKRYDFADWLAALDTDEKTKTLLTLKWS